MKKQMQGNTHRFQMNPQQLNRRKKKEMHSPQAIKDRLFKYLQGYKRKEKCPTQATYPQQNSTRTETSRSV